MRACASRQDGHRRRLLDSWPREGDDDARVYTCGPRTPLRWRWPRPGGDGGPTGQGSQRDSTYQSWTGVGETRGAAIKSAHILVKAGSIRTHWSAVRSMWY